MTGIRPVEAAAVPNYIIADMNPGSFWCRDGAFGISLQDAEAFAAGRLGERRADEIRAVVEMAALRLLEAECPGVAFWMPARRAMA